MKKSFLALAMVGMLAFSCGQKKEEVKNTETVEQTQEKKEVELKKSIEWTAFKTPEKVGVKGTFDDIQLNDYKADATTLEEGLTGANFVIVTSSVSTNDAGRDEKLKMEFFAKMVGNISGYFGQFKDGKVLVNLTMNGLSKEKEFTYVATADSVTITGSIDILSDFTAQDAFDSLHNACKDLHEGKTWSDVDIVVEIKK